MGNNRQNWYLVANGQRHVITCDVVGAGMKIAFKIWVDGNEIYDKKGFGGKAFVGTYPISLPTLNTLIELDVKVGIGSMKYKLRVEGREVPEATETVISTAVTSQQTTPQHKNDNEAVSTLKKRLALGEIDEQQYEKLLKIIES